MKFKILHETTGRLRVHLCCGRMSLSQADVLEFYLRAQDGVQAVRVYDRTQDAVVLYEAERGSVLRALAVFSFCLLYTSPSPRDGLLSRMPSSA